MTSTLQEVTQVQSLAAIRNFIRVAVSCITYLRGLCDDDSYETRQFLGLQLKQLVRSSPEAEAISKWLEDGAFDALNRGYLKELSLCVYNVSCTELLESYTFVITYDEEGSGASFSLKPIHVSPNASMRLKDGDTVAASRSDLAGSGAPSALAPRRRRKYSRQEVQQMLLDIITKLMHVVETLPPLTCQRVLLMRLAYYDAVTPPHYEPACFSRGSAELVQLYTEEVKRGTSIASMKTSHHTMSVTIRHPFCTSQSADTDAAIFQRSVQVCSGGGGGGGGGAAEVQRPETIESERHFPVESKDTAYLSPSMSAARGGGNDENARERFVRCDDSISSAAGGGSTSGSILTMLAHGMHASHLRNATSTTTQLSADDVTLLVLLAFVLTKCPVIARGCVTRRELNDYVANQCPLEVTDRMLETFVERLAVQGFLAPRAAADPQSSRSDAATWSVSEPSPEFVHFLLTHDQVGPLLPPDVVERLLRLQDRLRDGYAQKRYGGASAPLVNSHHETVVRHAENFPSIVPSHSAGEKPRKKAQSGPSRALKKRSRSEDVSVGAILGIR